ncbi:MAG: GIY-YIG nuclease family protein [Nitrospirae bacterium]|nr:GIY-YIG nuclease family protein [Nitrospirota bacterium]
MIDKQHILDEIRRTGKANGGKPLGREKFESETGIKISDWYPGYWLRWGDALLEAGFSPNKMAIAYEESKLVEKYVGLIHELGHFPVEGEIRRKSKQDPSFPVIKICAELAGPDGPSSQKLNELAPAEPTGFVYLMKSGRYYKIGRSAAVGRREYELGIQLPEKVVTVHTIKTDDPTGIEVYWHKRFQDRRKNGEWFELTTEDVKAFKRRKFM